MYSSSSIPFFVLVENYVVDFQCRPVNSRASVPLFGWISDDVDGGVGQSNELLVRYILQVFSPLTGGCSEDLGVF